MKILRAIRSMDPQGGGVASSVQEMSIALKNCGHEVEIVSLGFTNRTLGYKLSNPHSCTWSRSNELWLYLKICPLVKTTYSRI